MMRKILLSTLCALSLSSSISISHPVAANAPVNVSTFNENKVPYESNIDSELVQKANPYITLDAKTKDFGLNTSEAKKVLDDNELAKIQSIINQTNKEFGIYKSSLIVNGTTLKQRPDQGSSNITPNYIDHNKAFDWELTWYGLRMYWSHGFCEKLRENIVLYGAGVAGFNAAMNATLAYYAITPPGWLTSFITAVAGVGVWAFLQQDEGCGVYLECIMYVPTKWHSAC
ncbi:hypothetical protein [Paenibacillus chitinolyticus]|uniref:hypothetical protein n=1 Tax=Paenibacillus chitinolyticus TaxID=79263 RepID=UPI0036720AEE